jgi:hypothetical protein
MPDPNALPAAGWYPDPEDAASDRWWNGISWSDHRRGRNQPTGWAPVVAQPATASARPADDVPPVPVAPGGGTGTSGAAPYAGATRPDPYAGSAARPDPYAASSARPDPYAAVGYPPAGPASGSRVRNPLALGGMITSLVALAFNFVLFGAPGITGGILSIFGLRAANRLARQGVTAGNGRGMAIAGIVTGFLGAFLWDWFYVGVILNWT